MARGGVRTEDPVDHSEMKTILHYFAEYKEDHEAVHATMNELVSGLNNTWHEVKGALVFIKWFFGLVGVGIGVDIIVRFVGG